MSSVVADLEAGLQAMLSLKPPGVSGTRIQSITTLCVANVQSESVLIQKLYTHFKKAPGTHKLGVLYVVDSVTRKWTEQAKSSGQPINSAAEDGTFAAGVHRVKELLPVLMNDIISSAPDDQKEKIKKLVDIWEKGQTFPLSMLTAFKEKLSAPSQNSSTTPPGSPPSDLQKSLGVLPNMVSPTAAPNTSSILAALANMARQNVTAPAPANNHLPRDNSINVSNAQNNHVPQVAALSHSLPFPQVPQPVNVPAPTATFAMQSQGTSNGLQNFASNQTPQFAAAPPIVPPPTTDPAIQQQVMLINALLQQGVAADKIAGILAAMGNGPLSLPGAIPPPALQYTGQNHNPNSQNGWSTQPDESRDHNGYHGGEAVRSPGGRFLHRSRSRSPTGWDSRNSPARRRDESSFDYERDSPGRSRGGRARGNDYRQRSPPRRGRSPSPQKADGASPKWIGHDPALGPGKIKVLSRTLFVGGVSISEPELRKIFEHYGQVQTCIVNKEKRHAFVKMFSRADALTAKDGMDKDRTPETSLRTRWGVGFGPRDCSDYQTGVSIIPINKLTDADRKWMLTAPNGGSGGKSIEPGMVVEEPDIEIGQGVSSKAISRRMQTDKGGNNGPKSSRDRDEDEPRSNRRRDVDEFGRDVELKEKASAANAPPSMPAIPAFGMPAIPGFPFGLPTHPNGMPIFPPGFVFPGTTSAQPTQPPPPGHRT